jgi:ribonuclease HII
VYAHVVRRAAAYAVVVIPAAEVDRVGLHVSNVMGMRRALASLSVRPGYVLSDGFAVPGLEMPGLAVWKGDRVAACIAAASVLAKVTRDRLMVAMHDSWPEYDFASHKGYVTPEHQSALVTHGPCPEHRRCYVNVRNAELGLGLEAGFGEPDVDAIDQEEWVS